MKTTFYFTLFSIAILSGCAKKEEQVPLQQTTTSTAASSMAPANNCCITNLTLPSDGTTPLRFHLVNCQYSLIINPYGDNLNHYTMNVVKGTAPSIPVAISSSNATPYTFVGVADFSVTFSTTNVNTGVTQPFNNVHYIESYDSHNCPILNLNCYGTCPPPQYCNNNGIIVIGSSDSSVMRMFPSPFENYKMGKNMPGYKK